MDKKILKKIAKEWCASILLANGGDSFWEIEDGLLTEDEQSYIVSESHNISRRIMEKPMVSLELIINRYYTLDD